MSNNPKGNNQYNNGTKPSDDILRAKLLQYTSENLRYKEMISGLAADLGYHIQKRKLADLLKRFEIPTARRNSKMLTEDVKQELVHEKLRNDPYHRKGPNTIKSLLHQDLNPLPRSTVRSIQKTYEGPAGPLLRAPGMTNRIQRKPLLVLGPGQEMHSDGHEKWTASAIQLGDVSIGVYGFRQHVGHIPYLTVVPDARHADAVGHLHLDMIEACGYRIPVQCTVDKGSETGELFAQQVALRYETKNMEQWPAFVAVPSTRNIMVESMWKWLLQFGGREVQEILKEGKTNGIFKIGHPVHKNLFHWLWSQILQSFLDSFREYWNSKRTRYRADSGYPSGTTPNQIMRCPEEYGLRDCSILVSKVAIDALRHERLPPRKEVLRWVDDVFEQNARAVYEEIGSPRLDKGITSVREAWAIFQLMAPRLESIYRRK
ncbi:hypothetical protein K435DRAFT_661334 [Dendrothele bispora CBS 962.96]|uniref:Integrase catalytic domain-containing protein n=1 Tax=Dendrothele bispora (strain CBS 962.96) TaxID=1314807 RepID=A0A4S8M7I5_DENBC|nr:hypothetical protein K435DRAFT_661334 [Dendrothele bispora CBS 962.96]